MTSKNYFYKLTTICLLFVFTVGFTQIATAAITEQEVKNAQQAWGSGLVSIGKAFTEKKDYTKAASDLIDNLYAYQTGQVLFNPTKTSKIVFRSTKEGALSYFVGHNKKYPEDKGFALAPWTNVRFQNAGIIINDNVAFAMGQYFFTPTKGALVKVDYTFGYEKYADGEVKIVLHHSSLPYSE